MSPSPEYLSVTRTLLQQADHWMEIENAPDITCLKRFFHLLPEQDPVSLFCVIALAISSILTRSNSMLLFHDCATI
jgi:hypothetical protein